MSFIAILLQNGVEPAAAALDDSDLMEGDVTSGHLPDFVHAYLEQQAA